MSLDVLVVAQRQVSQKDLEMVNVYNSLVKHDLTIPDDLYLELHNRLGDAFDEGEFIDVESDLIEVWARGDGDVMHGSGKVIKLSDLPPDTVSIRIYVEA